MLPTIVEPLREEWRNVQVATLLLANEGKGMEVTLSEQLGLLHADLRIGANVAAAKGLRANGGISSPGFKLHGAGFIATPEEAQHLETDAPIKWYGGGNCRARRPVIRCLAGGDSARPGDLIRRATAGDPHE